MRKIAYVFFFFFFFNYLKEINIFPKFQITYEKKLEKAAKTAFFEKQAAEKKEKTKLEKANKEDEEPPPIIQEYTPGKPKDISGKLARAYHPLSVEAVWDRVWEENGYYKW